MTKDEVIAKTFREMIRRYPNENERFADDPNYRDIVRDELLQRLPDCDIKTCDDFEVEVDCCITCHQSHPHYDMLLMNRPEGTVAWVCCTVAKALRTGTND